MPKICSINKHKTEMQMKYNISRGEFVRFMNDIFNDRKREMNKKEYERNNN